MGYVLGSRKRSVGGGVAVALVMAMLIAACGGSSGKASPKGPATTKGLTETTLPANVKPTSGGSVTFALEAESTGGWCLPEAQLAISGIQVARAIYDYLTLPNDKGGYDPDLADKITHNADFTVWQIHVRPGIKFQNGTPLDGQVVKDNLDAYRGTFAKRKPLLFTFVFDDITSTSLLDPMTVQVTMKKPWASFPASLYSYGRLGIMAEEQLNDGSNCFDDMIGTGPFEFKGDWVRNDHLTVVSNPDYWRKDPFGQQLPYLDQITFKPVTEERVLVDGFSRTCTTWPRPTTTPPSRVVAQLVKCSSMVEVRRVPRGAYTMLNDAEGAVQQHHRSWALAYAVNRDSTTGANKGL